MEVKNYIVTFADITYVDDVDDLPDVGNVISCNFVSDAVIFSCRFFDDLYDAIYDYGFFDVKIICVEEGW